MTVNKLLEVRNSRKKVRFVRQNTGLKKRLKAGWRRPKGLQSKLRLKHRSKGRFVSVGYKAPRMVRGLSSDGKTVVRVATLEQLEGLDPKKHKVLFVGRLGLRKRILLIEAALSRKLPIQNYKDAKAYIETQKKLLKEKKKAKEKPKKKEPEKTIEEKIEKTEKKEAAKSVEEKKKAEKAEKDKVLTKRQ